MPACRHKVKKYLHHNDSMQMAYEAIKSDRHDLGDKVIEAFCRTAERPVIVLTCDTGLHKKLMGLHTRDGHAVGIVTTSGFLQAMEKAHDGALGEMLGRYCGAAESNVTGADIFSLIKQSRDRTGGQDIPYINVGDILCGTDKSGKPGVGLDRVFCEGVKRMQAWEAQQAAEGNKGDINWGKREEARPGTDPHTPPR